MRQALALAWLTAAWCLPAAAETVRIATFNASLARDAPGALAAELEAEPSAQARAVVEVVRTVRPDVLVLNEIDFDADRRALGAFYRLLTAEEGSGAPLEIGFDFTAPVNTGVQSGLDLDGDGEVGGPGDAWGYGRFPGQYGMAVLSRFVIDYDDARTFRQFRWRDLPDNRLPAEFYGPAAERLPLSSKSHWDVPIRLGRSMTLHLLVSHPTPPVFDGPEDRNGRRNADEVDFWRPYIAGGGPWLIDDQGRAGGLAAEAQFVILGDLNLAPTDGDGRAEAIRALLAHPRVQDPAPASAGGRAAAGQGGANAAHDGDPALDTADWRDVPGPGNLRVDYVLPSTDLRVVDAGVYWPAHGEPGAGAAARASDHRLVWIDLELP